jgi:hypothetical protein
MSIVPRRIWPGRLDDHAMQGCCAEWSAMLMARRKRSLFTKKEFSFLKLNLVVRADLWAYILRKPTCWKAAPDALSRPSTIKDFVPRQSRREI